MKVVLLGYSGAGKTSYMAALYGVMQHEMRGFQLRATDPADHDEWLKLVRLMQHGDYPPATARRDEYRFDLYYRGQPILDFAWADYRGAAIMDTRDQAQTAALLNDLQEAAGVMLFCDARQLAERGGRGTYVGRMVSLVGQAVANTSEQKVVAIVLTKIDQVPTPDAALLAPFQGLVSAVAASDHVKGAIVPVACGTKTRNVPIPLLYTLHVSTYLHSQMATSLARRMELGAAAARDGARGFTGFVDEVKVRLFGGTRLVDLANQMDDAAAQLNELRRLLGISLQGMASIFEHVPVIARGTAWEDYGTKLSRLANGRALVLDYARPTIRDPFDAFDS